MKYIIIFFLLSTFWSCADDAMDAINDQFQFIGDESRIGLPNDPYTLNSASINTDELILEVTYSGGCQEHDFYVVWPEVITAVYPPEFPIYVHHDGKNDECDAELTETRTFQLSGNPLGLSLQSLNAATITVINASNEDNQVVINP